MVCPPGAFPDSSDMTSRRDALVASILSSHGNVESLFESNTTLPLLNLDWGATSVPNEAVEKAVRGSWDSYGNPHSCGTVTGARAAEAWERVTAEVLQDICPQDSDAASLSLWLGGAGASHWLAMAPAIVLRENPSQTIQPIIFQRELHTSLVLPWEDASELDCRIRPAIVCHTLEDAVATGEYLRATSPQTTTVLLATPSSHVTGKVYELGVLPPGAFGWIVCDTTCHLTHSRRIPPWVSGHNFLAVFSGHKFPGGPGSPGGMVAPRCVAPLVRDRGTKDLLGAVRLREALRIRGELMASDGDNGGRLREMMLAASFRKILEKDFSTGKTRVVVHRWDDHLPERPQREPIVAFSLMHGDRAVHPSVVSAILLNAAGIQLRTGGMCADYVLSQGGGYPWSAIPRGVTVPPIIAPAICRISIPSYLLTGEVITRVTAAFQALTSFAVPMCALFMPTEHGWTMPPVVESFLRTSSNTPRVTSGCKSCRMGVVGGVRASDPAGTSEKTPPPPPGTICVTAMSAFSLARTIHADSAEAVPVWRRFMWTLHPTDREVIGYGFDDDSDDDDSDDESF